MDSVTSRLQWTLYRNTPKDLRLLPLPAQTNYIHLRFPSTFYLPPQVLLFHRATSGARRHGAMKLQGGIRTHRSKSPRITATQRAQLYCRAVSAVGSNNPEPQLESEVSPDSNGAGRDFQVQHEARPPAPKPKPIHLHPPHRMGQVSFLTPHFPPGLVTCPSFRRASASFPSSLQLHCPLPPEPGEIEHSGTAPGVISVRPSLREPPAEPGTSRISVMETSRQQAPSVCHPN